MRVLYLVVLAVLVMCPAMGCSGEDGSSGAQKDALEAAKGAAGDAAKGAQGAVEQAGGQVAAAAETFKSEALGKLDEYEGGLNKIKEGAKALDNEELNNTVEGISGKIKDVRETVTGLKLDKLTDLNEQKSTLTTKLDEIKGDLGKAQGLFDTLKSKMPKIPGQG